MGDCQNFGPFLGPYYNTGPNTGPNLGNQKRDHNSDNHPYICVGFQLRTVAVQGKTRQGACHHLLSFG